MKISWKLNEKIAVVKQFVYWFLLIILSFFYYLWEIEFAVSFLIKMSHEDNQLDFADFSYFMGQK